MEKAAKIIREEIKNVEFIIMGLSELKSYYRTSLKVAYDTDYLTRRHLTLALTASGTVTLENALLGVPMIVLYHLPLFMYFIIKSIVHVSNISIVNLIVNRQIVPEFIQHSATPKNIAGLAVKWLKDPEVMENIKSEFARLPALLGQQGAVDRAAKIIIGGINDI
jgi:lipid-A-disaccharide synthase